MLYLLLLVLMVGAWAPRASAADGARPEISTADANAAELQIRLGLKEYWRLRFHEAERHFEDATRADPESAAAHYYLAYTVYKIAEPKRPDDPGKHRAQELFAKAFALDPNFIPAWR